MTDILSQLTEDHRSYLNRSFSVMAIPEKNVSTCFVPKKEYETLSEEEKVFIQQTMDVCIGIQEMTKVQFGQGILDWYITPITVQGDSNASELADYMIYGTQKEALLSMALRQFQIDQKETQSGTFVCFTPHKSIPPKKLDMAYMKAAEQAKREKGAIVQMFHLTPDAAGNYWAVADPITGARILRDLIFVTQTQTNQVLQSNQASKVIPHGGKSFANVAPCVLHRQTQNGNG